MNPLKRWHMGKPQPHHEGFTLVEVLVMMIVLLIFLAGVAALFSIITRNTGQFKTGDNEDDAIAFDLSEVQRINNRYTCKDVTTTTGACSISSSDLNQNDYFPTTPAAQTNFEDRCRYNPPSFDLVTDLAALIPANSQASADLAAAGVTRNLITNDQGNAHRYTVTYSSNGTILRILTLVPSAAFWCP